MPRVATGDSISASAQIDEDVEIGPFCVVESGSRIGAGCRLHSHVVIKSGVVLGRNNTIHAGAIIHGGTSIGDENAIHERSIIGGLPLVRDCHQESGRLEIGSHNTIRELATIQRAARNHAITVIGDENFIMPSVQIGHDCQVGCGVTMTNYSALAGHVVVEDRATLGIGVQVHQHCRIGTHAMVGASAYVPRDVLPFVTLDGQSGGVVGINLTGLRRNGFAAHEIDQLKRAYRVIYRSGLRWNEILATLNAEFFDGPAARFREFFTTSSRGYCRERRGPAVATIPLPAAVSDSVPAIIKFRQQCA